MFKVRPATPSDTPSINEIYTHYVLTSLSTLKETPSTPATTAEDLSKIKTGGLPYLVATDPQNDGEILGFAYVSPFNERSGNRFTVEDTVYVRAESCGRGIGSGLLRGLVEASKESMEMRVVVAKISMESGVEGGSSGSWRMHCAVGFREVGRLVGVGEKFGRRVDVVVLQMEL